MRRKLISYVVLLSFILSFLSFGQVFAEETVHSLGCIPVSHDVLKTHPRLSTAAPATGLPSVIDLSSNFPTPGDQGIQGSCVAWATAYAYKTFQEGLDRLWGVSTRDHQFSPAYVYNQIHLPNDGGAYTYQAMDLLVDQGVCSLADMPYNQHDYTTQPNTAQRQAATQYKALRWGYLSSVTDMKNHLAAGDAFVFDGIPIYPDFDNLSSSNKIYDNTSGGLEGYHDVCVVGYDDSKNAFKVINSWGTGWGLNGYGYISYDLIQQQDVWGMSMADRDDYIPVTGINLNKDSTTINVGESEDIVATVSPDNATNKSVTWSSSDNNIVTVDSIGKVTAAAPGTATITARTDDGGYTDTYSATVLTPPVSYTYEGFEKGSFDLSDYTPGYSNLGTITSDPSKVITGKYSVYASAPSTEEWYEFMYSNNNKIPLEAGATYKVTFRAKTIENTAGSFYFGVRTAVGGNIADVGQNSWTDAVGNTYTKTSTFTLEEYSDYSLFWGVHNGGAISIDDIQIEKLN